MTIYLTARFSGLDPKFLDFAIITKSPQMFLPSFTKPKSTYKHRSIAMDALLDIKYGDEAIWQPVLNFTPVFKMKNINQRLESLKELNMDELVRELHSAQISTPIFHKSIKWGWTFIFFAVLIGAITVYCIFKYKSICLGSFRRFRPGKPNKIFRVNVPNESEEWNINETFEEKQGSDQVQEEKIDSNPIYPNLSVHR